MIRALLVWPLALLLAACGSTPEPTNRDRLPRRAPATEAPAPPETPPTPAAPEAPEPVADGPFEDYADYERQRAAASDALDAAIGTPEASALGACKSVPVGAKACGGPLAYRVYAATGTEELDVLRLAGRVTALDGAAIDQFGLTSTCDLTPEPQLALVDGVCTAR
jgi:hypothetical protein